MPKVNDLNFSKLKIDYAESIVDTMDTEALTQFAIEKITEGLDNLSLNEIKNDIKEYLGEETLKKLITKNTTSN